MADEIKKQFPSKVSDVDIKGSEITGSFEVYLQGELIYSKLKTTGRLPHPGEVEKILAERLMDK